VRFLQGTLDGSVDRSVALRLLDHADGDDIHLLFVKGADHSFSTLQCLAAVVSAILDVTPRP
jgi:hypothetical protein